MEIDNSINTPNPVSTKTNTDNNLAIDNTVDKSLDTVEPVSQANKNWNQAVNKLDSGTHDNSESVAPSQFPDLNTQGTYLNPNEQYGGTGKYLENQLSESGEEIHNIAHEIGVHTGISNAWSVAKQSQRLAQSNAYDIEDSSIPLHDKILGLGASLVTDPELMAGVAGAKVGMYGVRLVASVGKLTGGRVVGGIVTKALEYKPITFGLDGAISAGGYTGAEQLNDEAIDKDFDYSDYATNAVVFGTIGGGIGALLHHSILSTYIAKTVAQGANAIKKGINPAWVAIGNKPLLDHGDDAIKDEVLSNKQSPSAPVGQPKFNELDGLLKDNLDEHNNARKDLGLPKTDNPITNVQMNLPTTLSTITDGELRMKLKLPDENRTLFNNPIDEASLRAFTTSSERLSKKWIDNIKKLTGSNKTDILKHGKFLEELRKERNRPNGFNAKNRFDTVYNPDIDHIKPLFTEDKEPLMVMRGETPYTKAKGTTDSKLDELGNKINSLSDKLYAGTITDAEAKTLNIVKKLHEGTAQTTDSYLQKENDVLDRLRKKHKDINQSIQKVNQTALEHHVLRANRDLRDNAFPVRPTPKFTDQDLKILNNEPIDSTDELRQRANFSKDLQTGEYREEMNNRLESLDKLNPDIKKKGVYADLEELNAEHQKALNLRDWLKNITTCLMGGS